MRLLQINVTANWGSTGKIAENIGKLVIDEGWESWIAYGRGNSKSDSNLIRIGNDWDMRFHGIQTRLFDNHGLASVHATKNFIKGIESIKPDIIHLHNIHGYYLNYKILFEYLKKWGGPIVWTLHDCWSFTGHCSHYSYIRCDKWKQQCFQCTQLKQYPASLFKDRSYKNYIDKKQAFTGCKNLTIIPVSEWLAGEIKQSFLGAYPSTVLHNGVDTNNFRPSLEKKERKMILGVASVWNERKGLKDFFSLRELLPSDYNITLVGLTSEQIKKLPHGVVGIRRTESLSELVDLYSRATVFVNPTLEDTFPTTNLEALACGTPVITYNTGGSPESIDYSTGCVVSYNNVRALKDAIVRSCEQLVFKSSDCRNRVLAHYDKNQVFQKYLDIYNTVI